MAFARDVYTATGGQTDFTISFPYLDDAHVTVSQNGTTLTEVTHYTFPNATTVRLVTGATAGDTIVLKRATSPGTRLVDYTAGVLVESDLDTDSLQGFYLAQESSDTADLALGLDNTNNWDAENKRITNVAEPTALSDAVTKSYVDTREGARYDSEEQTATASQTVFTLTSISYEPGVNNLSVYINGVRQAPSAYTETSGSVVTFTSGLTAGDLVQFVSSETTNGSVTNAANVTYAPGGTGSVQTNVQDKLRESVSLKDFGAVGDGTTDDTAAIQAWWDYILDKLVDSENQTSPVSGFVPAGIYLSTTGLVLTADKYAARVFGVGWHSSVFSNVQFNFDRSWCELDNIGLRGNTGVSYGVIVGNTQTANHCKVTNCYVRDRATGIWLRKGAQSHVEESHVHRCGLGIWYAGDPQGHDLNNTEISSCTTGGVLFENGGELKGSNVRILSNSNYGLKIAKNASSVDAGAVANIPIESYFNGWTITENGTSSLSVTSVVSYAAGSQIEVTLSANHQLTEGCGTVKLTGTGVGGYDDVKAYVVEVTAADKVVLDVAYVSNATGSLVFPNFDLQIVGSDVVDNKNMHFVGGNINNVLIDGGYNIQFWGTRLKRRIWMQNSFNSQISFFRVGPSGEYGGGSAASVASSERVKSIPISGPTSNVGWVDFKASQGGKSGWGYEKEFLSMLAPSDTASIGVNQQPDTFNEVRVGTEGTYINNYPFEVTFSLANDSATSITIPDSNNGALIYSLVSGGGQPNLTYSGLVAIDAGSSLEAVKYFGGGNLDTTTGTLTGTTGTVGKVTISSTANTINFENRTGGTRSFKVKYLV